MYTCFKNSKCSYTSDITW